MIDSLSLDSKDLTQDEILRGKLTLFQPKIGYRFSVDPLLLADFVSPFLSVGSILDIGAGVGIVGLLLGRSSPLCKVTLVELQPRLAQLCRKNVNHNCADKQALVIEGDILDKGVQKNLTEAPFQLVVSCPPYYRLGTGGINPNTEEALARHEVTLPLTRLVEVSRRLMSFRGQFALVYPSTRLSEVLNELWSVGLRPTRLRLVHPKPGQPAQRALVLSVKGGRGDLVIEPPFFIRDCVGNYTADAQRALGEQAIVLPAV